MHTFSLAAAIVAFGCFVTPLAAQEWESTDHGDGGQTHILNDFNHPVTGGGSQIRVVIDTISGQALYFLKKGECLVPVSSRVSDETPGIITKKCSQVLKGPYYAGDIRGPIYDALPDEVRDQLTPTRAVSF